MAKLEGVSVEKLQGGLNRLASGTDDHVALVVTGLPADAVATAINNTGKGKAITSVYEAEQLGIDVAYDANNNLTIHADIVDFFRLAPEATLYLFNDVTAANLTTFLNHNKEIKGFAYSTDFVDVAGMVAAINAQQTIVNDLAAQNRFIDFVVLGFNGQDDFTQDLMELDAPNVSVTIACRLADGVVAMGAPLGMIAVRQVNENLGSLDIISKPSSKRGTVDYSLTDSVLGVWLNVYTTAGNDVESLNGALFQGILDKGYIAVGSYEGYPGYFLSNSHTCIAESSDFAYIENNRTWNKAARIIRVTLLPKVKGTVKKDPVTGFIAPTTASSWKALMDKALEQMVIDDEISGFETQIDYKQVVNAANPVIVQASVVADGIVHEFKVQVGLTNNI